MRLFEHKSFPNPRRVRVFAAEKGLQIECVHIDLLSGEHLRAEHLKRNPYGAVPTLELDDGTCISECAAICRYIESRYPHPLLMGATPRQRAIIEMWDRRVENGVLGAVVSYFHHGLPGVSGDNRYRNKEWGQHNLVRITEEMRRLDRQLSEHQYIAGAKFSIADITAVCAVDFALAVDVEVPVDCIHLQRWYRTVTSRPSTSV